MDVRIEDGVKGECLLCILGLDAISIALVNPLYGFLLLAKEPQGRGRTVAQNVEVVVPALFSENGNFSGLSGDIHLADGIAFYALDEGFSAVEVFVVLDLACLEVFRRQVKRFGLDPQVDVFGNEHHLHVGLVVL